ncbi:uncharacterized protein BJ171DRAFT_425061 [Polychytrium aggregatum]|uniref:uncharacterized protein n=1 Tax=Polychytrium aggregatum TaxID=110093 RepID=UPI0022FF0DD0|nr:uncharacterized protein BJ171DRAFT_425061 [Polychytrium aggregatum]KAI9203591.1 hypothetical protein BJ171DRAFT_425061 [Polychytrium aggregatum]
MLKRVLDGEHYKIPRVIEDSSSPTSADSPLALSLHTPPHGTHPPPGVDLDDYLQLAIYYHEQAELDISIYYLELSIQKDKNPLAFFLLGICLRHGWGREPSRHRGFQCLINSADLIRRLTYGQKAKAESHASKPSISGVSAQLTTPQMASPMTSNQSIPTNSHIGSPMGSISAFKSAASLSVFKSVASLMSVATRRSINSTTSFHTTLPLPPDIEVVKAILPLPLYEIGICLSHGWGTPVSKSAAAYYFRAAAAFGDRDAELEYGYCLLRGMGVPRDKLEAAKFLRLAEQKGCSLTGESWIHKPKWGGAG